MLLLLLAGYIGEAKGAKQMLWERGHWRPGLTLPCCRKMLKDMPDFRLETSELCNLWCERGHGFQLGVKCHPEMAGCGIEYCWGTVLFVFGSANSYILMRVVCMFREGKIRVSQLRQHKKYQKRNTDGKRLNCTW